MDRRERGRTGEDIASVFLEKKGYEIVSRNFSCRFGEIDIIARNEEFLTFVEVKLRKDAEHGEAREFVTRSKQKKILLAAKYYLAAQEETLQPRFDVVEIYLPEGSRGKAYVRLIEDAFC